MPRCLIVDDSITVRLILRNAIERVAGRGTEVHEATNGDEALREFREHRPDVVFLDLMLTDTHGVGLLQAMLKERPGARVVLCTGLSEQHPEVVRGLLHGAFGYVPKPIRIDSVRRVLHEVEEEPSRAGRIRSP